ncbi:MAG: RsmB/NOP family class I SAM-dependent RNA methyltransferase [Candidatus Nanoarchaeia archaeon]|nr:RsmB/NOP family class I SAM-dependent RNA methyltransferase [Candidatus Nanoarchaeia archaeon]MDD5239292.1 RsmB/NOP family class I SAM-dependent RNA methyltransferase [Candidatus Nanoarchaeia archaeon]
MFEEYGYNPEIIERYLHMFGTSETEKLLKANSEPLKKAIRVNTLRTDIKTCCSRLEHKGFRLSRVNWCNEGFFVDLTSASLGATTEHLLGYYYIQDATSMAPAIELSPSEKDYVLDMTAAPGGKTTHLAQLMKNKGIIVASDHDPEKMKALRNNIQRCGVTNTILLNIKAQELVELGVKFDKVLLDAPCTCEGTFSKNTERKKTLVLDEFKKYSDIQRELIGIAKEVLKPGGVLLYSTCSLAPEENELQVEYAVEKLGFEVLNLKNQFASKGFTKFFDEQHPKYLEKCGRFFPHRHNTQGFFMAKLKKA